MGEAVAVATTTRVIVEFVRVALLVAAGAALLLAAGLAMKGEEWPK